jgi:hypothetical protein
MSNNSNNSTNSTFTAASTTEDNFSHSMSRRYAQDYISKILVHKSRGEISTEIRQEARNMYNLHGQDRMLDNIVRNVSLDPRVETQRFDNEFGNEEFGYVHVRVKDQYQNKDTPNYF